MLSNYGTKVGPSEKKRRLCFTVPGALITLGPWELRKMRFKGMVPGISALLVLYFRACFSGFMTPFLRLTGL